MSIHAGQAHTPAGGAEVTGDDAVFILDCTVNLPEGPPRRIDPLGGVHLVHLSERAPT